MEAPRGLKQAHQHQAERNFFQRPVEVRFADSPHRGFQLIHPRGRGHPARFDVQLSHPLVIAAEERHKVLRQILFVHFGERAHNAEVERDVAAERLRIQTHLDIAGVHVGVEKTVAKYLGKKQ